MTACGLYHSLVNLLARRAQSIWDALVPQNLYDNSDWIPLISSMESFEMLAIISQDRPLRSMAVIISRLPSTLPFSSPRASPLISANSIIL